MFFLIDDAEAYAAIFRFASTGRNGVRKHSCGGHNCAREDVRNRQLALERGQAARDSIVPLLTTTNGDCIDKCIVAEYLFLSILQRENYSRNLRLTLLSRKSAFTRFHRCQSMTYLQLFTHIYIYIYIYIYISL